MHLLPTCANSKHGTKHGITVLKYRKLPVCTSCTHFVGPRANGESGRSQGFYVNTCFAHA